MRVSAGLFLALLLTCTTHVVSSSAAGADTISLRKCVNFMGGYAGSWFAKDTMFKDVKWPDRAALEFATRDLFNHARGKKGSGFKTNRAVTDWMVMHLSGIEHRLVRSHGYMKGLALTNKTSSNALQIILRRHSVDAETPEGPSISELKRRSIAIVPFYGGVAKVQLDPKSGRVINETLPAGAGNSHTLATVPLKLLQLSATVASVQRFFGTVVVGVVSEAEAKLVQEGLATHLPPWLLTPRMLHVQIIPCGDMSVYLPYRLLQWTQSMHKAKGLILEPQQAEASPDKNNSNTSSTEPAQPVHSDELRRRHRRLRVADEHVVNANTKTIATLRTSLKSKTAPPSPLPIRGRRLTKVLGMKEHHHHHKHNKNSGSSSDVGGNSESGVEVVDPSQRQPFDLVYYTEADNVLVELNREATARALLGFARAPDLGGRSYVAPNRLEGELIAFRPGMPHADVVKHFKPVGQNNCEDDRGDLEVFGPDGSRSTIKGTPH